MSEVSDQAVVRLLVADYANTDSAGKQNIIGGGVSILGYVAEAGTTAPFAIYVSVLVPTTLYHEECSVEIVLEDPGGNPVMLPGPAGQAQAMRIGQVVRFEEPNLPQEIPRGSLRARSNWVVNFANGLPLGIGQKYVWRVRIDHETRDDWTEEMYVPGSPPQLVVG